MFDPITRWCQWTSLHELIQHNYNEFVEYMCQARGDKDFENYLIVGRAFENLLGFMTKHENRLSCECDAYEEALKKCSKAV